jgi:hypothetical protein
MLAFTAEFYQRRQKIVAGIRKTENERRKKKQFLFLYLTKILFEKNVPLNNGRL